MGKIKRERKCSLFIKCVFNDFTPVRYRTLLLSWLRLFFCVIKLPFKLQSSKFSARAEPGVSDIFYIGVLSIKHLRQSG